MKVSEVNIQAGFTNRLRTRTDDAIVNIHNGEVSMELECILEDNRDVEEIQKFMDLVIKIKELILEHNNSL